MGDGRKRPIEVPVVIKNISIANRGYRVQVHPCGHVRQRTMAAPDLGETKPGTLSTRNPHPVIYAAV